MFIKTKHGATKCECQTQEITTVIATTTTLANATTLGCIETKMMIMPKRKLANTKIGKPADATRIFIKALLSKHSARLE